MSAPEIHADPFTYPDGDIIRISAVPTLYGWKVSDDGYTEWYRSAHRMKESQPYHNLLMLLQQSIGVICDSGVLSIEVAGEYADTKRDDAATKIVAAAKIIAEIQ